MERHAAIVAYPLLRVGVSAISCSLTINNCNDKYNVGNDNVEAVYVWSPTGLYDYDLQLRLV